MATVQDQQGFIYVLRSRPRNAIKIGFTKSPHSRIAQLRTASPDPLEVEAILSGPLSLEQSLHQHFAAARLRGEWFDASKVGVHHILDSYREFLVDASRWCSPAEEPDYIPVRLDNGEIVEAWDLRPAAIQRVYPARRKVWKVDGHEMGESSGGYQSYYAITDGSYPDPDVLIDVANGGRYEWTKCLEMTICEVHEDPNVYD